jgi:hypothetical protein
MDRYFSKVPKQKTTDQFSKLGRVVVVIGRSGIGKTWTVKNTFDRYIELTADLLRSKHDTLDFLEKIRGSDLPVVLDEYESVQDLVGLRELTGAPSQGVFVVTTQVLPKFDFEFVTYEFPVMTPDQIKALVPDASEDIILQSKGDLRQVFQSLTFKSDGRDDFQGPRDFVTSLVAVGSNVNPVHFIGHPVAEPGNIASILNANYVDGPAKKVNVAKVAEYFSTADIFETRVYAGEWDLIHFWNFFGCIMPAIETGHTLKPPLKPGSTWTKYQNMCMRHKKIQTISRRVSGKNMSCDELLLLRDHAEAGNVEILRDYKITPQDLDVLNHLSPYRKIKPKTLSNLKKCLAAGAAPSSSSRSRTPSS